MDDLISRSKLIEHLKRCRVRHAQTSREINLLKRCEDIVEEQPPVEAVPVVHGTWINTDGYDEWECDNCGYLICGYDDEPSKGEMKFCNMCGADMRKQVKHE